MYENSTEKLQEAHYEVPGDGAVYENPDEDVKFKRHPKSKDRVYENQDEEVKSKVPPESKDRVYANQGAEVKFSFSPKPSKGVYENTNPRDTYLVPLKSEKSGEYVYAN